MQRIVLALITIVLCSGQSCFCPWASDLGSPSLESACGQSGDDTGIQPAGGPSGQSVDDTDLCPDDPDKTEPGVCGCGVAETDTDGDGTPDCSDLCPADASKTTPGPCGCGISDSDTDGDGVPDCSDECPADAGKTAPGTCGCGTADVDADGDGIMDCADNCPAIANATQRDWNANGQGDACDAPEGASIVADDGQPLGILDRNVLSVSSISSAFGPYGDASGALSIWNRAGNYGSATGPLSPWNSSTTTPPKVIYQGSQIAFLTTNPSLSPAIHPNDVAAFIGRNDLRR